MQIIINHHSYSVWYVYRAELVLFQGSEGELQLRTLIFI